MTYWDLQKDSRFPGLFELYLRSGYGIHSLRMATEHLRFVKNAEYRNIMEAMSGTYFRSGHYDMPPPY